MNKESSSATRRKSCFLSVWSGPATKCLFILFCMLAFIAQAAPLDDTGKHVRYRRLQDASESVGSRSFRVVMSPFHLVLAKTPEQLDDVELDDLFGVLSSEITTYIRNQLKETSTTLQYMFLRDMMGQFRNEQTTLSFPLGGIAQFSGSDAITSTSLDEWTQYALEFILPGVLQSGGAGSAPLSQVEFSVYLTDRTNDEVPSIEDTPPPTQSKENKNDIVIIVISVAATLAIVAGVALLVSRYYGPKTRRDMDGTKESPSVGTVSEARSPSSDRPPRVQTLSGDDHSEGSFTVNTEAGDSTAIKSIHHNLLSESPIAIAEAFQHESTRVNVRKDMLSSTWVGDKSIPAPNLPPQVESVLAPSHFAASKEEHARRMRMHQQIQAEAWDDEGEVSESAIRFESAHELNDDEEEGKSAFLGSNSSF